MVVLETKTVMDNYEDGIFPNGIREFLLFSFFLSIEEIIGK
jgi:hypothetical protein